ncbi:sugar transferase [Actinoallomurus sp. NBC_01490]|uniref:sugar transferase n=1 Tax=Actinoallomurus sp. NBC_01490 TaxID=2903557 RepID=UPI002E341A55|nr:sugar transferase [Actinoallomurus sp. NBC_01490]
MAVVEEARPRARPVGGSREQVAAWTSRYARQAFGLDFVAALLGGLIAFMIRFRFSSFGDPWSTPYIELSFALPFLWTGAVALARGYEQPMFGVGPEEFRRILQSGFALTASVAILAYATKTEVARGYVIAALPLTTGFDLYGRYQLRKRLHRRRKAGEYMRRVVVVGHRAAVADLIRQLRREPFHGMEIAAACLPAMLTTGDDAVTEVEGVPVAGDFTQVAAVVERIHACTVAVLACPELDGVALRRLAWQLEKDAVDLVVAPALMEVAGPRTSIRPVAGLPLLHVEHPELSGGRRLAKSAFDRVGAGLALIFLWPVLACIAVAIRLDSKGPALFRQVRVGRDGREFTVLKFRTMVPDAERRKAALVQYNDHDGVLFKIRNDPRITRTGGWLRRYSLDELPQLINVLRGDMSLVGPRPPLPEEVAQYGDDVRRRLVVRPGMTGLWQVSGRSDLSWEESVRLDLRYVENWSLTLDLQILWKTWSAVARGSGAY